MNYIILVTVLLLLVIVILREDKEKESFFWIKIIIIYFLVHILFPFGVIVAFYLVFKLFKYNIPLKRVTLLFSLVVILVNFIIPPIEFNDVLYSKEIHNQMNKFETIEYVKVFANNATIQEKIKQYDKDNAKIIFKTYVLIEKDIPIKDKEWLLYDSDHELNFDGFSHGTKMETIKTSETSSISNVIVWEQYLRDKDTGEEYFGVFEKENGEFYLKYIIKGQLKQDKVPML